MNQIVKRRIKYTVAALAAVTLLLLIVTAQESGLQRSAFTSGYILLTAILFLAAYNIRKRFPSLPLGSSATWMQLHIYVAFTAIAIFVMHVGLRIPNGKLECLLAGLFAIVAGSGIYGLYITRTIPKRLTAVREEVIFERIPQLRRQVCTEARALVIASADSTDLYSNFYRDQLARFFESPRSAWYYLFPSGNQRRKLVAHTDDLRRYASASQATVGDELVKLIWRKDDVDYHHALQGRLKLWLFAHIGFTYSLILVSLVHAVMVHAFHGGLR